MSKTICWGYLLFFCFAHIITYQSTLIHNKVNFEYIPPTSITSSVYNTFEFRVWFLCYQFFRVTNVLETGYSLLINWKITNFPYSRQLHTFTLLFSLLFQQVYNKLCISSSQSSACYHFNFSSETFVDLQCCLPYVKYDSLYLTIIIICLK